jgi:Uma2 family endonuclease
MQEKIFPLAIEKYREFPEGTGVHCEVVYGKMGSTARPNVPHQLIAVKLSALLYNFLEETKIGVALNWRTDVYLEKQESVVHPDVLIIMNDNLEIIHKDAIYGVPDIIFEILCGNRAYDKITKKALYEEAGVKEYFIIDPLDKTVMMYTLKNDKFELTYELKGIVTSGLMNCSLEF